LIAQHESKPSQSQFTPDIRQKLAIEVLAKSKPISHLATEHRVSRKFLHQQGNKAKMVLAKCFESSTSDHEVVFYLPITKTWLFQLILALVLICHSSYRGVVELFRDLFDIPISIGTSHNRSNLLLNPQPWSMRPKTCLGLRWAP
jgi:hypothetical protein